MAVVDSLRAFKRTQPIGAAPNTREFVAAQGDLETALGSLLTFCRSAVPAGLILPASLSAANVAGYFDSTGLGLIGKPWAGWAICNGNNGTPSLDGKFPRFETSAAGATGGSDSSAHTHAVDPGSFTSGAEAAHTHGTVDVANGSMHARIDTDSTSDNIFIDRGSANWTADAVFSATGNATAADSTVKTAGAIVQGATSAGSSHTHAVDVPSTTSGAASVTENRPAYYELIPVMRL